MQQRVQTYIEKHQLLTFDKPVIVGVSGGTDSVVLLHLLVSLGYDCIIAHCNFHLRMEESNRDEQFVRSIAKLYNLPFYSADFETTKYSTDNGISIEMAARDLRYNWFATLQEKLAAQAVAVAHHADDSIETMFLNLVRGTGLRGMTGISPTNKNVVRPLLCCSRSEIENYLIEHELEHVEDSTNALSDYRRNKIRNEVLPLLTEINPSVRQTLYETMEHFIGTQAIYQQAIDRITNEVVEKSDGLVKINLDVLKMQLDVPTVLYELLYPYNFNPDQIQQIYLCLNSESGKIFNSETHRLVKDRNTLIINAKSDYKDILYSVSQDDEQVNIPFLLTINKLSAGKDFQASKSVKKVHVDASKLEFPLTVRGWLEGDSFYPFGMKKRKKLSDFFIDNKLSLPEKEQVRILLSGDEIVWIIGYRLDNRFRITDSTTDVVEFSI